MVQVVLAWSMLISEVAIRIVTVLVADVSNFR